MQRTFLVACLGVVACGGGTVTIDAAGANDAASNQDASQQPDSSVSDAGVDATTDAKPPLDAKTPFDAPFDIALPDANFACTDPSTCNGGFCCADLVLNGGTLPNCSVASLESECKTKCDTQLVASCNAKETVRLCSKSAHCTEAANANCCLFDQQGKQITFCVDSTVKLFAKKCF